MAASLSPRRSFERSSSAMSMHSIDRTWGDRLQTLVFSNSSQTGSVARSSKARPGIFSQFFELALDARRPFPDHRERQQLQLMEMGHSVWSERHTPPSGINAIQAELATDLVERSGSRDRDGTVSRLKMSDAGDAWSIADNPRKRGGHYRWNVYTSGERSVR